MNTRIEDLRDRLFGVMDALKDGSMDIETAKQIGSVAQVIVNSAKVEAEFMQAVGGAVSNTFIGVPESGIVSATKHFLK